MFREKASDNPIPSYRMRNQCGTLNLDEKLVHTLTSEREMNLDSLSEWKNWITSNELVVECWEALISM